MYLADSHTHSCCSPDSMAPLMQMARAAHEAEVRELYTTDHFDFLDIDGKTVLSFDWRAILKQYETTLSSLDFDLKLRLGIEMGSPQFFPEEAGRIVDEAPLDFVLGSVHNMSPEQGGTDFYFMKFDTEADCHRALEDYVTSLEKLAGLTCYDSMAHIIYPLRYMKFDDMEDYFFDHYQERLADIFKTLAQTGHALELNTNRGRDVESWRDLMGLYRRCGGELVTLGSDAHVPEHVGLGLPHAQSLLKDLGFRYFTVYQQRKPQFIKL